tara:strand:- start:62 stop:412 length:351 start_codon:yes stop_codon:yes gene_type:complete
MDHKIKKLNKNIINDTGKYYNFTNITSNNDLCDSIGLKIVEEWRLYFQIFLTNSKNNNYDNEEYNTYQILLIDYYDNDLIQNEYTDNELQFNNIEDAISFVLSNKDINNYNKFLIK